MEPMNTSAPFDIISQCDESNEMMMKKRMKINEPLRIEITEESESKSVPFFN